jgi:transcriptional regulator with XRE-family HTH domain
MVLMNRVREWRRRKGLSIEELARRSRTTASQISKLERGERRLTVDWMTRLAKGLGCRREDLLPNEAENPARPTPGLPLDRELLRRMARALTRHLQEEGLTLSPQRFLETAMALHDLIGARSSAKSPEELPAELKPVIRLISGD